ncbi:MAG: 1-acyl-sn-glycerol-3-phosphate acyltransferase [Flavobacteriaceae bacterium]
MGLSNYIFKNILGWKIKGSFNQDIKKSVIIVVPHTSWHDFFVGLYARKALQTPINWLGKKELFTWPLSYYFRWTGGTPLDRTSGQNKVEAIAKIFQMKEEFRLAMAPEGTRKKVAKWKTGFYYIAKEANVPIIPVAFDYGTKTVKVGNPFYISGDIENDLEELRKFFEGVVGKKY